MEETKKAVAVMYSPETGEKTGEIYPGDRILRKKSEDYLTGTVEILKDETYTKIFGRAGFRLARALTGAELQMIYLLVHYISFDSGILMHSNGKPITRYFLAKETGMSERTVDRILQGLKEKQVLGKHVSGREVHYTVNPWLFMKGNRINRTLYEFFKNTRWAKIYDFKRCKAGDSNGGR